MNNIQVFSKDWFKLHQARLLWLANTEYGRDVLCINGKRSSIGKNKIVGIEPNAITWMNELGQLSTEFRINNKFGRRIYYSYKAIWEAMHWFDMKIANPFIPAWNLGFDTLTAYPDADPETSTVDGATGRIIVDETWATFRSGVGNHSPADGATLDVANLNASTTSDQWKSMQRGVALFDTSPIDTGEIKDATLSFFGSAKFNDFASAPDSTIVSASPASNTDLVDADYNIANFGTTEFASRITYASWSTSAYNDFTLNASGEGNIDKSGISKFGARSDWDLDNSPPTWGSNDTAYMRAHSADAAGTSNDPKLVVNYALADKQIKDFFYY